MFLCLCCRDLLLLVGLTPGRVFDIVTDYNLELVVHRGTEELERESLGSQQAATGRKTSAQKVPEGYRCEGQTNPYRKGFWTPYLTRTSENRCVTICSVFSVFNARRAPAMKAAHSMPWRECWCISSLSVGCMYYSPRARATINSLMSTFCRAEPQKMQIMPIVCPRSSPVPSCDIFKWHPSTCGDRSWFWYCRGLSKWQPTVMHWARLGSQRGSTQSGCWLSCNCLNSAWPVTFPFFYENRFKSRHPPLAYRLLKQANE